MKFSTKLLTVLLPITATSALVPVLTSCNKGSAWDFSYGDSINCYKTSPSKDEASYHSIDDIKNAVKNHTAVESTISVTETELVTINNTWSTLTATKQTMYFDFIASHSLINSQAFYLQWDMKTPLITLTHKVDNVETVVSYTSLAYHTGETLGKTGDEAKIIYICLDDYSVPSYNFKNTKGA